MNFLLFRIILVSFMVANLFSAVVNPNTGWSYLSSDQQTFYIFIGSIDITDADGTYPNKIIPS